MDKDEGKIWWTSGCGRFELCMTIEQAEGASHPGECIHDVEALSQEPEIMVQLLKLDPFWLREELDGYGAWNEEQLADHEQNLKRILWLAAGDIAEGNV